MLAVEMIYSTWWWYWRTIIMVIRVIWIDHNDDDSGGEVDCDATEPTILCCPWAQARPRVFSRPTSRGGSFSFFLSSFLCSDNQQRRNIELTKKQRRLCGSLEEGGSTELSCGRQATLSGSWGRPPILACNKSDVSFLRLFQLFST